MNSIRWLISGGFLVLIGCTPISTLEAQQSAQGLVLSLHSTKDVYNLGEPISLVLEIQNTNDYGMRLPQCDPWHGTWSQEHWGGMPPDTFWLSSLFNLNVEPMPTGKLQTPLLHPVDPIMPMDIAAKSSVKIEFNLEESSAGIKLPEGEFKVQANYMLWPKRGESIYLSSNILTVKVTAPAVVPSKSSPNNTSTVEEQSK